MTDEIILVDDRDNDIGSEEKELCHRLPVKLHRAFSIFIFNGERQMIIQKRSTAKKTWPGFWSNACCSHPRKGEDLSEATLRRLQEELGFTCPLQHIFTFRYNADYSTEFGESEIDHVFIGQFDGEVKPNGDEIDDWQFISFDVLSRDVAGNPEKYTPWFKEALPEVIKHITEHLQRANEPGQLTMS
jgi:isopentenyl-diphosphate delta-isomerase